MIDRPAHPGWFYLTLFFIVLPCMIRIFTTKTDILIKHYFSCCHRRRRRFQNRTLTKLLLKLLLIPILPALVIINQLRQIPLLFKIYQEKERLDGRNEKEQSKEKKSIKIKLLNLYKILKNKIRGGDKVNQQVKYDDAKVVAHIEDAIKRSYERPIILLLYDQLIPLTEDKFLEAFMESAPQMILQLKIALTSKCRWESIFLMSTVSSFFNLAATITNYSVKFRQKNPPLRQASLVGKVFLVISKVPFLLSRTLAISFIFALPKNGVFYGFSYIMFGTIVFAVYEYSQMTSEDIVETIRKSNWFIFLTKLFTRGYISNFILLEDRLIRYNGKQWHYQSDEHYSLHSDQKQHIHQLGYMTMMSTINFLVGCILRAFPSPSFNLNPHNQGVLALAIMFGGLLSLVFSILYQSTKHLSIMSQLGPQAKCMLHLHLINCYKNDFPSFLSTFPSLRPDDGELMLNLKEKSSGKTLFIFIDEDKNFKRERHVFAIVCCLEHYPEADQQNHLKNCINVVCEMIKENNINDLENGLRSLSRHKERTLSLDFWNSLNINGETQTYTLPLNVINEECSAQFTERIKSLVQSYMGNIKLKIWKDNLDEYDIIKKLVSSFPVYSLCFDFKS